MEISVPNIEVIQARDHNWRVIKRACGFNQQALVFH